MAATASIRARGGGKFVSTMPSRRQNAPVARDTTPYKTNPLFLNDKTQFRTTYSSSYVKYPKNIVGMSNPAILKASMDWTHKQAAR